MDCLYNPALLILHIEDNLQKRGYSDGVFPTCKNYKAHVRSKGWVFKILALSQWSRRVCLYIFILQYYRSFRIIFKDSNKLYTLVRHQNKSTTNINIAIKPGLLSVRPPAAGGYSLQCQGIDNFSVVVGNGISPKCSLASPWHIIWDTSTSTVDASVRNYACPALSCYKICISTSTCWYSTPYKESPVIHAYWGNIGPRRRCVMTCTH